jgi:hypothetical protein
MIYELLARFRWLIKDPTEPGRGSRRWRLTIDQQGLPRHVTARLRRQEFHSGSGIVINDEHRWSAAGVIHVPRLWQVE